MKKFILKIILFSFIIVCACILIDYIAFKKFDKQTAIGNPLLKSKYDYFLHSNYNTVAIGSSKILRQFDANLFDSLCSDVGTRSFNLGVEGTYPPETYYLLQKILTQNTNLKYILLEVRAIEELEYKNWHTIRSYYWYDSQTLRNYVSLINEQKLPYWRKLYASFSGFIAMFDKSISIGKGQFILNQHKIGYTNKHDFEHNRGYDPFVPGSYIIPKDTSDFAELRNVSEAAFKKEIPDKYNKTHLAFLSNLTKMANKKGIKLIFVMNDSQKGWMYDNLLPLLNKVDSSAKIVISDASVYPELYYTKYKANLTHLNEAGSKIYSLQLAKDFHKINH